MLWFLTLGCSENNPEPAPKSEPVVSAQNEKNPPPRVQTPAEGTQEDSLGSTLSPQGLPVQLPVESSGPKVTFSGTVVYTGTQTGSIELEVLYNEREKGVVLIKNATIDAVGEFSIEVPENPLDFEKKPIDLTLGSLSMMAYIDITGDRISDDDPRGYLELSSLKEQNGLSITILDAAELEKQKEKSDSKKTEQK